MAAQQRIGFGTVGHAAGGTVVVEFLADAVGDEAEQHLLNHVAAVFEVAGGFEAGVLAGVEPFLLEAVNRRQDFGFRTRLVIGHVRFVAHRQDDAGIEIRHEETFRAFEHRAVTDFGEINIAFGRAGHGPALIPTNPNRAAPIVGGMLEVGFAFDGRDGVVEGIAFGLH